MKDKIKKFYTDHEDAIAIVTFVAGVTAAVTGTVLLVKSNGDQIMSVRGIVDDNKDKIGVVVILKNGKFIEFFDPDLKK